MMFFFYHDGGPDHRLKYYSVMISYICAFQWLNLDYLVAVQTAPNNSWTNPCERLMSQGRIQGGAQGPWPPPSLTHTPHTPTCDTHKAQTCNTASI